MSAVKPGQGVMNMDFSQLVEQIALKVADKIAEEEAGINTYGGAKPRLLVLTQEHGEKCHEILESTKLCQEFDTCCALLSEYTCCEDDFDVLVLFNLTNETMAKVSAGICTSPYEKAVCKAILSGKRIYVPNCAVELHSYKDCAPVKYYAMMEEKIDFLKQSGVVFCDYDQLEGVICGECIAEKPCSEKIRTAQKEYTISKKVITERDVIESNKAGCTALCVHKNAIVTELAKDAMKSRGICLIRA